MSTVEERNAWFDNPEPLGDCEAVACENPAFRTWGAKLLCAAHIDAEVQRIERDRAERGDDPLLEPEPPPPPTDEDDPEHFAGALLPVPIDWTALYNRTNDVEWLVEDVWPLGRQLHIHAARKTGKSLLMLSIAASLAVGRSPFTGRSQEPRRVTYLDFEMTEDDLLERVEEMGFGPDELANLRYYLWPALGPLDTPEGGRALLDLVRRDQSEAVVVDTVSRVVEGEENSNDTFRNLFRYTGMHLKAEGVAMARLDHEGHEGGRSRGASAKADDVDIVWQLKRSDDGLSLVKKAARISWVPEHVDLHQTEDPLGYRRTDDSWPAGTRAKADQLDALDVPIGASKREAREAIKAAGEAPGRDVVLLKALAFRRQRSERLGGVL